MNLLCHTFPKIRFEKPLKYITWTFEFLKMKNTLKINFDSHTSNKIFDDLYCKVSVQIKSGNMAHY